jgi:hypothetical protein
MAHAHLAAANMYAARRPQVLTLDGSLQPWLQEHGTGPPSHHQGMPSDPRLQHSPEAMWVSCWILSHPYPLNRSSYQGTKCREAMT